MANYQGSLSQKFLNLRKEYNTIQTELSNSKIYIMSPSSALYSVNNTSSFIPTQPTTMITNAQDKQKYKPSLQVLEEFRNIIEKTNQLTSKGPSFNLQREIKNQYTSMSQENNLNESNDSLQIDDEINITNSDSDEEDILNNNGINIDQTNELDIQFQPQNNSKNSEIDKLKAANQILSRSNIDLKNSNKILELELSSYQTNSLYDKKGAGNSQYDDNLSLFILGVKNSLVQSIKSNIQLQEIIEAIQIDNEKLANDNMQFRQAYSNMRNEIEYSNRKNAEIQIANEDNTKMMYNLEEDNQKLKEQLITIQNEYEEQKNEEENMKLINDSNCKRKQDNDDLVSQLKATIDNLLKGNTEANKGRENAEREIEDSSKNINAYLYSIQELNYEVERKEAENDHIEKEIEKKKELLLEKEDMINGINLRLDAIKQEVEETQRENEQLRLIAKDKEEIIFQMKNQVSFITSSIENSLPTEDYNRTIDERIIKAKRDNARKDAEIEELTLKFEDILNKKEDLINKLESISKAN